MTAQPSILLLAHPELASKKRDYGEVGWNVAQGYEVDYGLMLLRSLLCRGEVRLDYPQSVDYWDPWRYPCRPRTVWRPLQPAHLRCLGP